MARFEKVAQALKREISQIIHDELKDPRLGFVTIIRVDLTPDLKYAKVFYSVLGKEEQHQKTQEALNSALGYIRHLIARRINLRFTPEIFFKEDRSCEYSIRIEEVLNQIKGFNEHKKSSRLHKKQK